MVRRRVAAAVLAVCALTLPGCAARSGGTGGSGGAGGAQPSARSDTPSPRVGAYTKVMLVVEENHAYGEVADSPQAHYLDELSRTYGAATAYDAGYPGNCPSLPGYLLLTSGTDHGVCDDDGPDVHRIAGDNLFRQVAASGQEWRVYAQSMPAPCARQNAGAYLVRHTVVPYYDSERDRCAAWDLPMGTPSAGALHEDVAAGRLPAFSLVVPDACNDMHGGHGCPDDHLVGRADGWLQQWLPGVLAAPDYRAGRLVVVITWDESSSHDDNHVPTLVISPTTSHVRDDAPESHCTTLGTVEEVLHLPALGCAARVSPSTARFHL